jgi:hypothetical protein
LGRAADYFLGSIFSAEGSPFIFRAGFFFGRAAGLFFDLEIFCGGLPDDRIGSKFFLGASWIIGEGGIFAQAQSECSNEYNYQGDLWGFKQFGTWIAKW